MLSPDQAILLLHGEVNFAAVPHLQVMLDNMIVLGIPSLTVDLSGAGGAAPDALGAIRRREFQVHSLNVVEECWP